VSGLFGSGGSQGTLRRLRKTVLREPQHLRLGEGAEDKYFATVLAGDRGGSRTDAEKSAAQPACHQSAYLRRLRQDDQSGFVDDGWRHFKKRIRPSVAAESGPHDSVGRREEKRRG